MAMAAMAHGNKAKSNSGLIAGSKARLKLTLFHTIPHLVPTFLVGG
jgi:hypothetical protein